MLFDRSASIRAVTAAGEEIEITGLRIKFTVTKTLSSATNKAVIEIYNLSESTRSKIEPKDTDITLMAGYLDDAGERLVFRGSVTAGVSTKPFPDVITKLELGDGAETLRETRVSESFGPGSTVQQVVTKMASELGVAVRETVGDLSQQFLGGFSFAGPAKQGLDKMAAKAETDWSIQDGELQFVPRDLTTGERVVILNSASGLVGSPQPVTPPQGQTNKNAGNGSRFEVKSLLFPHLKPGDRVQVDSNVVSGLFKCEETKHEGDTHGPAWNTNMKVLTI